MESTGEMEAALKFYKQAADPLSLVRVYCYCGNVDQVSSVFFSLFARQKKSCFGDQIRRASDRWIQNHLQKMISRIEVVLGFC